MSFSKRQVMDIRTSVPANAYLQDRVTTDDPAVCALCIVTSVEETKRDFPAGAKGSAAVVHRACKPRTAENRQVSAYQRLLGIVCDW